MDLRCGRQVGQSGCCQGRYRGSEKPDQYHEGYNDYYFIL